MRGRRSAWRASIALRVCARGPIRLLRLRRRLPCEPPCGIKVIDEPGRNHAGAARDDDARGDDQLRNTHARSPCLDGIGSPRVQSLAEAKVPDPSFISAGLTA